MRTEQVPSLRWVQLILTKARPKLEEKREIDQPWSLGLSEKYGISPEATGSLLEMGRWAQAVGKPFTIRQAKWVAHLGVLCGFLPGDDILESLYDWAVVYAQRERACEVLDQPFNTTDLDAKVI